MYLNVCVQSILSGYYHNIEVILVENGSEDSSGYICDKLTAGDKRVHTFHVGSIGVSAARNYGMCKSRGEYICFIDADDFVSKDYVEYLVDLIIKNNVDVAVAKNIVTFRELEDTSVKVSNKDAEEKVITSENALKMILLYQMTVVSCFSRIFKMSFLKKNKVSFVEELFIGEGFNFNVQAFSKTERVAVSNKVIYFYRVNNPHSAMTKVEIRKIKNGLLALTYLEKTLSKEPYNLKNELNYAKWHTNFDFLMLMLSSNSIDDNFDLFASLINETRKGWQVSKSLPINMKEKFKSYCASIFPVLSGKLFNHLRKRKIN